MSPQRARFIFPTTYTDCRRWFQWVEHSPVSTITSSSPIEFIVSGSGEDYMDLNNTLLEVKACIKTTNDSPVSAAVAVAPINNTLHSLFSQIDVSLNDVNVSSATTTYPYRAFIETHLNYGTDANNQGFKRRCTLSMTT